MTVGWIREGDLDAFYAGTETTPDPGPQEEPGFPCPFCGSPFRSQAEFHDHVHARHRVERPFIMLRGREPDEHVVLRSPLAMSEIVLENTSHARVRLNGASPQKVSADSLREFISGTSSGTARAELKLELVNATEQNATPVVTCHYLSFRVAEKGDLERVEQAFTEILASEAITISSIRSFLDEDKRTEGPGKDYASGLAKYCLGILIKEPPEGENLTTPVSRYREWHVGALDVLKDFPHRPLARLIACIIRFSLNHFEESGRRTGYGKLDLATGLLSDPASASPPHPFGNTTRQPGASRALPICPIDHGTGRVLDLADHLAAQTRWSPDLDDECRAAHSDLLDLTDLDRQKVLAIWAASAWRLGATDSAVEPLEQIAGIPPFSRWASKYLEQAST